MPEGMKSWMDPKFLLTLALVLGGGYASFKLMEYKVETLTTRVETLEGKVSAVDQFDNRLLNVENIVNSTKKLVIKLAQKQGIEVIVP